MDDITMPNPTSNNPQEDSTMQEEQNPLDPVQQAIKIERLGGRIGSLESTVRSGVELLTAGNEELKDTFRQWRIDYERQRDDWRRDHEESNRDSHSLLGGEIRHIREALLRVVSVGSGVGLLVGVVVSGFLYTLNYRFQDQAEDIQRVERTAEKVGSAVDRNTADVSDIKIYLATGGRIPGTPYKPNQRKQSDDKRNESQPAKRTPDAP